MNPKRKMDESDFKSIKKGKPERTLSSYIEEERQKMLLDKESLESIEIYLRECLKKLEYRVSIQLDDQLPGAAARNRISSLFEEISDILGSVTVPDIRTHRFMLRHMPSDVPPLFMRPSTSRVTCVNSSTSRVACINSSLPTVTIASLMAEIRALMRNWNPNLYQQCMINYELMRKKNTLWDNIIMKAFPPAMLEHCTSSNIIADFFHSMCKEFCTMDLLVRIKSSYMQFFLMNMAAVNRIEHSAIVNVWEFTKADLLKRAIIAGQATNVQLLLHYFRPNNLWSCPSIQFLKGPLSDWVIQDPSTDAINSCIFGYCRKLTLFNIARIATYVAESQVPNSVLADCIRLLWRASESPYVTLEKIRNAVEPQFNRYSGESNILVRACRDSLLAAYPKDCLMENQPRSLMHLSRCKIRQNIISAVYVPFLPVPNHLIEYINLEW